MRDTGDAFEMAFAHLLVEIGDARDAARTARTVFAEHGDATRIVATIFEATQSFDQDGNDITLRNRADNATHVFFLFSAGFQGARSRARVVAVSSSS